MKPRPGRQKAGVTFWDRVYAQVEREGECLIFVGCKNDDGYGRINKDGKLVFVHRAVWERDHGTIPLGMVVMHSCDRPACIEPQHLSLGTQAENIKDMERKGRRRVLIGVEHSHAKLTDEGVREIKKSLGDGETCAALARHYRVSEGLIRSIKKGRNWTHVQ